MSAREISLTRGLVALVDESDYDELRQFNWYAQPRGDGNGFYAARRKPTSELMHRRLLPTNQTVDHVNGDGLDNRRSNLRIATGSQNQSNRKGPTASNTSGYIGVGWHPNRGWRGQVRLKGRNYHAGYFATAVEAAHARDALARELHGDFACLNFPPRDVPVPA